LLPNVGFKEFAVQKSVLRRPQRSRSLPFKVNSKALSAALFLLIGALAPAAEVVTLPAMARALATSPEKDVLVAALALEGVTFLPLGPGGLGQPTTVKEMPTLAILPLGGSEFLLGGRFGKILHVRWTGGAPTLLQSFPVEGTPTGLMRDGDRLLVASAAGGLLILRWEPGSEPTMMARYPFVDYTKEVHSLSGSIVVLADNLETGMQILDLADPAKPLHLATVSNGFVDSVTISGSRALLGDRKRGGFLYDLTTPSAPHLIGQLPIAPSLSPEAIDLKHVTTSPSGKFSLSDSFSGVTVYGPDSTLLLETTTGALASHFLDDQRLVISQRDKRLVIVAVR
jgi:hypothetical protein